MKNMNNLTGLSKLFLFSIFLDGFAFTMVVHAQDQSGFISIDCGIPANSNYTDETTGIYYSSDSGFVDSGVSKIISPEFRTDTPGQQFENVRSFPEGERNCYILRPARVIDGNTYLVRAWFMYGNYDAKNQTSVQFHLYIGVDFWDTVIIDDSSTYQWNEIIHVPPKDYIHVCLVNIGLGTPFISALELRPLDKAMYETQSGSLNLFLRFDLGSTTDQLIRYKDDPYDRIWNYRNLDDSTTLTRSSTFPAEYVDTVSDPPHIVMSTADTPNISDFLYYSWEADKPTDQFYIYMHFSEVEVLQANQSREFFIYLNEELWYEKPVIPSNMSTITIYGSKTSSKFEISINKTRNSTLLPIMNALEIYNVRPLNSLTDEKDVSAMMNIKAIYGLKRNWQGDPCAPEAYVWDGLSCSYNNVDSHKIISLNLSSSGLTGEVPAPISNLTMIQSLDLSNNNFTGQVPEFLSQLTFLKVLNLKGNKFTSPVPAELLLKSKNGSLSLSIDGIIEDTNPPRAKDEDTKSSQSIPWKIIVPVVVLAVLLIAAFSFLWVIKRKKQVKKVDVEVNKRVASLEEKKKQFTYSEIVNITTNFDRVVGKGGFGTVYHGYMGQTQVAVKMLSPSSVQGYKEFQTEANLLMSVHHKNLTSLVGYCNEGTTIAIIYEFMAYGNLRSHLSDTNPNVLKWKNRLRIAVDAAQGLEYLHHGCKPPIIHRDVKSTNILLNEKFQAKLSDFGLSRVFPVEDDTHVSTIVAGTPGYLDPEYYISSRFTEKSDVYSFGIVLLELITGRSAIPKGPDKTHISQWVSSGISNGDVKYIVDPRLRGDFHDNSVWKTVELAMACVSHHSTERPTMDYVAIELKECLATEIDCDEMELKDSTGMMHVTVESEVLTPLAR